MAILYFKFGFCYTYTPLPELLHGFKLFAKKLLTRLRLGFINLI